MEGGGLVRVRVGEAVREVKAAAVLAVVVTCQWCGGQALVRWWDMGVGEQDWWRCRYSGDGSDMSVVCGGQVLAGCGGGGAGLVAMLVVGSEFINAPSPTPLLPTPL